MSHESREQSARVIEKVRSLAEVLPTLDRGAKAVMLERRSTRSVRPLFDCMRNTFKFNFFNLHGYNTSNVEGLKKAFAYKKACLIQYDAAKDDVLNSYDYIFEDLMSILKHFPNYHIVYDYINFNKYKHEIQDWHCDEPEIESHTDGAIRIVRTYIGRPTEYALDKRGTGRTALSKPGVTVHTIGNNVGAWHKAPAYDSNEVRCTVGFWLKPL